MRSLSKNEIEQMQESWNQADHRDAAAVEDVMKRAVKSTDVGREKQGGEGEY